MKSKFVKTMGAALILALAAGCATKGELAEVRALADAAQRSADQAKQAAGDAQRTGSRAQQAAADAQTAANRAQATADQAAISASDANKCCAANSERLDRMFEKAQRK
jgi:hypothetical protein